MRNEGIVIETITREYALSNKLIDQLQKILQQAIGQPTEKKIMTAIAEGKILPILEHHKPNSPTVIGIALEKTIDPDNEWGLFDLLFKPESDPEKIKIALKVFEKYAYQSLRLTKISIILVDSNNISEILKNSGFSEKQILQSHFKTPGTKTGYSNSYLVSATSDNRPIKLLTEPVSDNQLSELQTLRNEINLGKETINNLEKTIGELKQQNGNLAEQIEQLKAELEQKNQRIKELELSNVQILEAKDSQKKIEKSQLRAPEISVIPPDEAIKKQRVDELKKLLNTKLRAQRIIFNAQRQEKLEETIAILTNSDTGVITITDLMDKLDCSRSTADKVVEILEGLGIIKTAPEVINGKSQKTIRLQEIDIVQLETPPVKVEVKKEGIDLQPIEPEKNKPKIEPGDSENEKHILIDKHLSAAEERLRNSLHPKKVNRGKECILSAFDKGEKVKIQVLGSHCGVQKNDIETLISLLCKEINRDISFVCKATDGDTKRIAKKPFIKAVMIYNLGDYENSYLEINPEILVTSPASGPEISKENKIRETNKKLNITEFCAKYKLCQDEIEIIEIVNEAGGTLSRQVITETLKINRERLRDYLLDLKRCGLVKEEGGIVILTI